MVYRFYCMALFHSQTRRHMINDYNMNESITFVTEIRNLPIKQLKPNNSPSVGRDWEIWLEEIEREFQYF